MIKSIPSPSTSKYHIIKYVLRMTFGLVDNWLNYTGDVVFLWAHLQLILSIRKSKNVLGTPGPTQVPSHLFRTLLQNPVNRDLPHVPPLLWHLLYLEGFLLPHHPPPSLYLGFLSCLLHPIEAALLPFLEQVSRFFPSPVPLPIEFNFSLFGAYFFFSSRHGLLCKYLAVGPEHFASALHAGEAEGGIEHHSYVCVFVGIAPNVLPSACVFVAGHSFLHW